MFKPSRLLPALLLALCLPAHANWHLDGESSRLSFVTGKNGNIAEVNRFLVLHGKVDRKGAAEVSIEMDSISSGIPLRDERMRDNLFVFEQFPEATVQAQID
ncbi:MAG: YceI family protein, partial [Pseudomonas sp.]|nr:YceI family protein [Pseudomonas sp.]